MNAGFSTDTAVSNREFPLVYSRNSINFPRTARYFSKD
ncbi:hypothetical protein HMPREF1042_1925 [Streptococcus constellatus subsp. pharyngis SK1060 = CCUG 46377]|uniref:Uncharacterized protein n=1 Tax=Streptococcus constellatus subsp. pharyngis SK1060 = CCUG 46377 TaxID=1035184 RepID=F9P7R2_STRCV|nr:hypothetical protein HMPREF1042_1925 [Streptococcus constellatus subsp. pharyngis SK1060 = CCUG 46377]